MTIFDTNVSLHNKTSHEWLDSSSQQLLMPDFSQSTKSIKTLIRPIAIGRQSSQLTLHQRKSSYVDGKNLEKSGSALIGPQHLLTLQTQELTSEGRNSLPATHR